MTRLLALLASLVLVLPACRDEQLTILSRSELPRDVYGSPHPVVSSQPLPRNGVIYLVRRGRLYPVEVRLQPVSGSLPEVLLFALFQGSQVVGGPAAGEIPQGTRLNAVESEIPQGTRLNTVEVDGVIATVDVSGDFEEAAPQESQALRIAQVVYTLTQEEPGPGLEGVAFEIDGIPQQAIGGVELGALPRPVNRIDYSQFAPAEAEESGNRKGKKPKANGEG